MMTNLPSNNNNNNNGSKKDAVKPPPFDTMGFVRFEALMWLSAIFWVIPLFVLLRWGIPAFRYLITTMVKDYLWTTFVLMPIGLLVTFVLLVWGVWEGIAYLLSLF